MNAAAQGRGAAQEGPGAPPWPGATDLHVPFGPEGIPRRFDAVQLAERGAQSGLRSLVLSSHLTTTSDWAQIVHRLTGVRLFGSVHVGGIDPRAVRAAPGPRMPMDPAGRRS
jgi:hypothetical protein